MPLSNEISTLVDSLEAIDSNSQATRSSVESGLIAAGVNPETATLEDFDRVALDATNLEAEPIRPNLTTGERDSAIDFSIDQAQKLIGSGIQTIGDLFGSEFLTTEGSRIVARQEEDIQRGGYVSTYNQSFADTLSGDGVIAATGWIWEKIQENLVSSAAVIGGTAAAAVTAPVSGTLAAVIGGASLVGGVTLGIGEVRQELEEKGVYDKDDALSAVGVGVAIGLLDRVGAGKVLNKGGIVRAINKPDVVKGLLETGTAKRLGKAFAAEGLTEAAQEAAIVGTAYMEGAEYTVPEVVNRLIDAGVVGGAIGFGSSTAQSGVVSAGNTVNKIKGIRDAKKEEAIQEEVDASAQRAVPEEQVQTQEEIESTPEPELQVFGKKGGYSSPENAARFGAKKAGDTPFDIVESDGKYIVQERVEQESPQVVNEKTIPEFASSTVSVDSDNDLGNKAFEVYERNLSGRRRVGDRLTAVADSVQSFLERSGISTNKLSPQIAEKTRELDALTANLPDDPSVITQIDKVKADILTLRDAGRSDLSKGIRRYLDINVGANFGDSIKNAQLDRASGRAASEDQARRALLVYREAVADDVSNLDSDQKQSRQKAYDDLLERVIVDNSSEVRFKLVDQDAGLTVDNIQTTEDGDLVYTINGVEHNAPAAIKEPLLEFTRLNQRERAYLSDVYFPRQRRVIEDDYSEAVEAVVERESELISIIAQNGGTDGLSYAAFDAKSGKDWIESILAQESATDLDSPLNESIILDGLNTFISQKTDGDIEQSAALVESFRDAITNSSNLQEFHENTNNEFIDSTGETPVSVVAALGGFNSQSGMRALFRSLARERISGERLRSHLDFIDQFNANPFHVSRSYQAYEGDVQQFLESRRNPKSAADQKVVDNYRSFLQERLGKAYGLAPDSAQIVAAAQRHMDARLNDLDFSTPKTNKAYGLGPEAGTSYGGIFNKRQDIAPEERAFLGEVTDPAERISHSLNRLARFRVNNEYANSIIKSSLGTGLFRSVEDARAAGVENSQEISIADPANASKLQGMYATPELSYILQTIDSAGAYDAGVGGFISRLSGATKASLTLLDPAVSAANAISGSGIVAENIPLLMGNFDIILDEYSNAINRARGKSEKKIDLKAELGIAGGSARAQDITQQVSISGDMMNRALKAVESVLPDSVVSEQGLLGNPLSKGYAGWTTMMMSMHKLGDDVPQRVIYRARERTAKEYYGMNDQQAAQYASDYARRTGIFAPYSPAAIKDLQKIPFIGGGFVGWYTGMLISVKEKASALGREFEMSADRYGRLNIPNYNSADANQVAEAKRQFRNDYQAWTTSPVGAGIFGLSTSVIAPSVIALGVGAIVGGLGSMIGGEDEETNLFDPELEEMIGRLSPEYYANIDRQVTKVASDGKSLEYINVTRLGNYGIFGEMLNQLFSSDPDESVPESVLKAMGTLSEPFLSPTFGLKNISEAVTGRDEFGREIYAEDDTYLEKTVKASAHVGANTFGNGFYRDASALAGSVLSDQDFNEFNGTEIEIDDFVQRLAGFKPVKFDAVKGLQQRVWEEGRKRRTAQTKFTSSVFTFNPLSDAEIKTKFAEVSSSHDAYYKSVIGKVEAARYFGLSDQEIAQALSTTGVSGYKPKTGEITGNARLVLDGKIPAYQFPADSAKNVIKKFAGRSVGADARNNLNQNIEAVERIIGGG